MVIGRTIPARGGYQPPRRITSCPTAVKHEDLDSAPRLGGFRIRKNEPNSVWIPFHYSWLAEETGIFDDRPAAICFLDSKT